MIPYFYSYSYQGLAGMPRRYYEIDVVSTYEIFGELPEAVAIAFVIFTLGQLTYFINLLIGLYKRTKQ